MKLTDAFATAESDLSDNHETYVSPEFDARHEVEAIINTFTHFFSIVILNCTFLPFLLCMIELSLHAVSGIVKVLLKVLKMLY